MTTKRKTKFDLQCELDAAKKLLAEAYAKIRKLEIEPGIFDFWWTKGKYAARPMPNDYELRKQIWDAAYELLLRGDFEVGEGSHTQLVVPQWDELPPGVDAAIIRYSYDENSGICVENVWPATQIEEN